MHHMHCMWPRLCGHHGCDDFDGRSENGSQTNGFLRPACRKHGPRAVMGSSLPERMLLYCSVANTAATTTITTTTTPADTFYHAVLGWQGQIRRQRVADRMPPPHGTTATVCIMQIA